MVEAFTYAEKNAAAGEGKLRESALSPVARE